jgi:3-oxoacyl-[acyl-carrier-protein] synthase II
VTGVGLVCALGIGTDESWKNLVAGVSGIGLITQFDAANFDCKIAGEVKNFDPFLWIEKKELKKMGRFIQLALASADAAVKHAQWKPEQSNLEEVGVYVSSGIGGSTSSNANTASSCSVGRTRSRLSLFHLRL